MIILPHRRNAFRSTGDITSNLIASWALNESSGSAIDSSSNALNMSLASFNVPAGPSGGRGPYSDTVRFLINTSMLPGGSSCATYTVGGWFNVSDTNLTQTIYGGINTGLAYSVNLYAVSSAAKAGFWLGYSPDQIYGYESSNLLTANQWNHIMISYNDTTKEVVLWLNGVATTGTLPGNRLISENMGIGSSPWIGAGNNFPMTAGYIAKVKAYARVLAAADVLRLYNNGVFGTAP